jgi:hypothetical protein
MKMTVISDRNYKYFEIKTETVFLYEKSLNDFSLNEISYEATNVTEHDKHDELVITLEIGDFQRHARDEKNSQYWSDKQPFAENSEFNKLKLVICYGHPDWLGRTKEKKSITFNPKDKSVFLCWLVDDVAVIDSIKSNIYTHKKIGLHIVLNEEDEFFKENEDDYLKNPKLRSFSLFFE